MFSLFNLDYLNANNKYAHHERNTFSYIKFNTIRSSITRVLEKYTNCYFSGSNSTKGRKEQYTKITMKSSNRILALHTLVEDHFSIYAFGLCNLAPLGHIAITPTLSPTPI